MRILKDHEAVLRFVVDDSDGNLIDPDALPTVSVVDGTGAPVTVGAVVQKQTGYFEAVLPPHSTFDTLTSNWSATVSGAERQRTGLLTVIAERLVPIRTLATDEKVMKAVSGDVPLAVLADTIEDWFNRVLTYPYCEQPFNVVWHNSTRRAKLRIPRVYYPREVHALTAAGNTMDPNTVTVVDGGLWRTGASGGSFLTGEAPDDAGLWAKGIYSARGTHGPRPDWTGVPGDLTRAGLILARYAARVSNYSERARQVATDGALITFSTPDLNRPTGLPEVDAVITGYAIRHFV